DQCDIDAMRHRPAGKQRKCFLRTRLPVASVDEEKRRPFFSRFEKVDTVALARAISEVEMIRILRTHLGRTPLPAGDDVGASGYRYAVVEAEVTLFLAHLAPVRRIGGRRHAQISHCGHSASAFPLCRRIFYRTTRYRE